MNNFRCTLGVHDFENIDKVGWRGEHKCRRCGKVKPAFERPLPKTRFDAVEFSFPETQRMDDAEMKKRMREMRESILRHYFGITPEQSGKPELVIDNEAENG